jgi:hypothetical protein
MQLTINCTALDQSELSNFVECTIRMFNSRMEEKIKDDITKVGFLPAWETPQKN